MTEIQKLLEPIAPEKPCGENLSYDQAFLDLLVKVRGKEETQFSAAEEPNWKELLDLSFGLAQRFKHLQLGNTLTLALLQTEGLVGFRDGLKLTHGWLEAYWETLYPLLDPEDSNDPTERVNILQTLSVTTFGDPFRFCDRLARAPLCESKTLGRFNLQSIRDGQTSVAGETASGSPASGAAQIAAAFRDTPLDFLRSRAEAVSESLAILKSIDGLLAKLVGAGRSPNFEALRKVLVEVQTALAPYVPSAAGGDVVQTDGSTTDTGSERRKGDGSGAFKKTIENRDDVLSALRAVCEYYQRREPSSPVPFLLQRAQRLVNMDFLQIVNDLAPESVAQMKIITGTAEAKTEKA